MNIHVGNPARDATEEDLRQAFETHGQVASATVIKDVLKDRYGRESSGLRFEEFPEKVEAQAAMENCTARD